MVKVYLFLKAGKVKSNGESPIYCKICLNGETAIISTGKSVSKERWEETNKLRLISRNDKEMHIKQSLDNLLFRIEKCYYELSKFNSDVKIEEIRNEIDVKKKIPKKGPTLLEVLAKHNDFFQMRVAAGERSTASFQKYNRTYDLAKNYMQVKHKIEDIEIDKITSSFVFGLESFMRYESIYKGKKGIDNNTVVKYFNNFKTMCNYGLKMDLISKNPFNIYDGKVKVKEAVFLTQEELNQIEQQKIKIQRLERVRDIFLFSCYTGYAPVDACKLTHQNIIKDAQNNLWFKTNRTKTRIRANVPILPACKRIIDKYAGMQPTLLPSISNQKMNAYLKELADLCNIDKYLTWYVARHTFATTVTLGNGIKIENVSAMMGHSNIKQTQHYAKILDKNVMEDMGKIMHKFN